MVYASARIYKFVYIAPLLTMPPRRNVVGGLDVAKLGEENKLIVSLLRDEIRSMKAELIELVNAKNERIEKCEGELIMLKTEVRKLKNELDDTDSYQRRETVILSGNGVPVGNNDENCKNVVCNLVKNQLKLNLKPEDISTAHRLGRKPDSQRPDKRNIIVKLCRRDLKQELIRASRTQVAPRNLYVNESLTPTRKKILFHLRQMKRAHPNIVSGCSSVEGRIYVYTKPSSSSGGSSRDLRHLVNDQEALVDFCREYIKQPLDLFLESQNS